MAALDIRILAIHPDDSESAIVVDLNLPVIDVFRLDLPSRMEKFHTAPLWLNTQAMINRNMSDTSFNISLGACLSAIISGIVMKFHPEPREKKAILASVLTFFFLAHAGISFIESCSYFTQSAMFADDTSEISFCWFCSSFCQFLRSRFRSVPKYAWNLVKSIIPTACFVYKQIRKCCKPSAIRGTPFTLSNDLSLWLTVKAKELKKTSIFNFYFALIGLSFSTLAFTQTFTEKKDKLMVATIFAIFFLVNSLYLLTESFSLFLQSATVANADLEKGFFRRLIRFFRHAKYLLRILLGWCARILKFLWIQGKSLLWDLFCSIVEIVHWAFCSFFVFPTSLK